MFRHFGRLTEKEVICPENKKEAVSKEQAIELFTKYDFTKERDIDAGEHHYGMIFISNK